MYGFDARLVGFGQVDRSADQCDGRAECCGLMGEAVAHFAGGMVGEEAYRIQWFLCRPGGDEHVQAVERQGNGRCGAGACGDVGTCRGTGSCFGFGVLVRCGVGCVHQLRHDSFDGGRFLHASLAGVAAGELARTGFHDRPAEFTAGVEVTLRDGVVEHVHVHRRAEHFDIAIVGEDRGGEGVVGHSRGDAGDDVGARWCDDQRVRPCRVGDVVDGCRIGGVADDIALDGRGRDLREHGGPGRRVRERREGERCDELFGRHGFDHAHLMAGFGPVGCQMACLERCDRSSDSQKNMRHARQYTNRHARMPQYPCSAGLNPLCRSVPAVLVTRRAGCTVALVVSAVPVASAMPV